MAHDIRIIPSSDFLRADVNGRLDLDASKQFLLKLAAATAETPERAVVVDFRDVPDDAGRRMSSTELAELVGALLKTDLGVRNKVAVLRRPTQGFDRAKFFELMAADRGRNIAAFDDFESAFRWLFGEGDPA